MRLSPYTQRIICESDQDIFGTDAYVKVFGSRLDDNARGNDIDLLVELPSITQEVERKALQLIARLQY
ncbi:hypothetical protein [Nitrosomonas eutropha]|nr:hypothetical protein [Nitrosomonas eutropha]PXV84257.1 hypothetical protein C8R14_101144 [Nitrosomonas eutropha]SCX19646.1 hypothetical protein SAMN05216379_11366 [Nitrosomonas eutropha]